MRFSLSKSLIMLIGLFAVRTYLTTAFNNRADLPGKTFLALSIALSIAAGHDWCGKRTKSGSVHYVAAEGLSGLRLRVQAYQGKHMRYAIGGE